MEPLATELLPTTVVIGIYDPVPADGNLQRDIKSISKVLK
jgi:hypothetical protein